MGIDELMKFLADKLKETVAAIENFSTDLAMANVWIQTSSENIHHQIKKIHHQIPTAMPSLSTAAVLLVVVVGIYGCCCCGGGKAKTMKATGRNRRMPRREFEGNPKAYFKNLHSHSD